MTPLAQVTTQPPRPVSNQQSQQNLATGLAIALTVLLVLAFVFQKKVRRGGLGRQPAWGHGRVSGRVRRQLENKVGSGTALRLVDYERSRVPGKSENWYWQAALERLARDHGRR
ncbi:MAG: hypothetical protein ACFCBU_13130 [Cyanophyceae cyanobacterium]